MVLHEATKGLLLGLEHLEMREHFAVREKPGNFTQNTGKSHKTDKFRFQFFRWATMLYCKIEH